MLIIRFFGGPLIWSSILLIIGGTAYGANLLYLEAGRKVGTEYHQYYLYVLYAAIALAVIELICVCCNLKNIQIGLAVLQCTAMFINGTPQVFILPFVAIVV